MSRNAVHLSLEFPVEEHFHLKMICARQRKSIKEFVTQSVLKAMHDYEKKILKGIDKGLEDIQAGNVIYRDAAEFEKYAGE